MSESIITISFSDIHRELQDVLYGVKRKYNEKTQQYEDEYYPLLPEEIIKEIVFTTRAIIGKEVVLSTTNEQFILSATLKIIWALDERLQELVDKERISNAQKNLILTVLDTLITATFLRSLRGAESRKIYDATKPNVILPPQQPMKV